MAGRPLLVLLLANGPSCLRLTTAADIWNVGRPAGNVEIRDDMPTPEVFYNDYIKAGGPFQGVGKPALFRGAARFMPAFQKWTDDYLKKQHGKIVLDQVETEKTETRTALPHEDWTISKFLNTYQKEEIYSTATTPKGLDKEMYLLPLLNCGGFTRRLQSNVLWFSSGSTRSVIHNDPGHNIHCMIDGKKNWILWHPKSGIDTPEMGWINGEEEAEKNPEEFKDAYGVYVGKINVDDVDLERFPRWGELEWWKMTMEAGDCAFIPGKWFHFVEAPAIRSVSAHVWFGAGKTFDTKACDSLVDRGYNLSEPLIRFGDCTWGWNDPDKKVKQTKCLVSKSAKVGSPEHKEL